MRIYIKTNCWGKKTKRKSARRTSRRCRTHPRPPKSEITWEESCDERSAALHIVQNLIFLAFQKWKWWTFNQYWMFLACPASPNETWGWQIHCQWSWVSNGVLIVFWGRIEISQNWCSATCFFTKRKQSKQANWWFYMKIPKKFSMNVLWPVFSLNEKNETCEGLTPYIHLAYHGLRVVWWSVKITVANLAVFISIQKKTTFEWHVNKNQILWFISSFAYVVTLRFCLWSIEHKSFNDITSQLINCWIEIRRTIFFL